MNCVRLGSRRDQVTEIPLGEVTETSLGAAAVTGHQEPGQPAGVAEFVALGRVQRLRASATGGPRTARTVLGEGRALVHAGFQVLRAAGRRITAGWGAAAGGDGVARRTGSAELRIASPSPQARIVAEADATRRRIERDLHDGSQQRLVTLVLEVRALKDAVPSERPDLLAQLSHVEEGLMAALEELREIAQGVHPRILSQGGLLPALKSLARRSGLPIELRTGALHRLPEPVEVAVYFVVSEALTNAVKHAHASIIEVEVTVVDSTVHVCVRDDGVGGADPTRGSGLLGLRDRVEALRGTITVQSPPRGGTALYLEIPLDQHTSQFASPARPPTASPCQP
jgi:signal transduction histidine kinase